MKLVGNYIFILITALTLVFTPVAQGYYVSSEAGTSNGCCGHGCACCEAGSEDNQCDAEDSGCECQMTNSEAPVDIPFEGQIKTINHETSAEINIYFSSDNRPFEPESNRDLFQYRINEHGPPLYKINSAYLI